MRNRKLSFIVGAVTLLSGCSAPPAKADSGVLEYDYSMAAHIPGYCQITVPIVATTLTVMLATANGAAQGGTCLLPLWATWAYFHPAVAGTSVIRCVSDSTALSTTLGQPLDGLTNFPLGGGVRGGLPFSTLKCISTTGSPVVVDIGWMG